MNLTSDTQKSKAGKVTAGLSAMALSFVFANAAMASGNNISLNDCADGGSTSTSIAAEQDQIAVSGAESKLHQAFANANQNVASTIAVGGDNIGGGSVLNSNMILGEIDNIGADSSSDDDQFSGMVALMPSDPSALIAMSASDVGLTDDCAKN